MFNQMKSNNYNALESYINAKWLAEEQVDDNACADSLCDNNAKADSCSAATVCTKRENFIENNIMHSHRHHKYLDDENIADLDYSDNCELCELGDAEGEYDEQRCDERVCDIENVGDADCETGYIAKHNSIIAAEIDPSRNECSGNDCKPSTVMKVSKMMTNDGQSERTRMAQSRPINLGIDDYVNSVETTFTKTLFRLIDKQGLSDVEVYKRANIDRKLFSKIRSNVNYKPSKNTVIALAVALQLNTDDAKDLLLIAGYALSRCSKFDLIVQFHIDHGIYSLMKINDALLNFNQPLLGY